MLIRMHTICVINLVLIQDDIVYEKLQTNKNRHWKFDK